MERALYNPDIVGQSQPNTKKNHWIVIKLDDKSPIVVLEVNSNKDNVEIVGWYTLDNRNLDRIKRQAKREGGELLILASKEAAASLSTLPSDLSSTDKDSDLSRNNSGLSEKIADAEANTDINPTEAQKEAGNYKKGHVRVGTFDISIEQPKGSVRSGVDANGKKWETTMQNTYGYIRGTEGVDGDHIDVFLSDDIDVGHRFHDLYAYVFRCCPIYIGSVDCHRINTEFFFIESISILGGNDFSFPYPFDFEPFDIRMLNIGSKCVIGIPDDF